jgi:hypothetical protein
MNRSFHSFSNQQKLFVSLIVSMFFIITVMCLLTRIIIKSRESVSSTDFEVFQSEIAEFSVKYPKDWVAFNTPQGRTGDDEVVAVFLPPGRSFPQVYIANRNFPQGKMDDVVEWGKDRAQSDRSNYQEISISNIALTNNSGILNEYTWQDPTYFGNVDIRCEDLYLLEDELGYAISFCAYPKQWNQLSSVAEEIFDSFKFSSKK